MSEPRNKNGNNSSNSSAANNSSESALIYSSSFSSKPPLPCDVPTETKLKVLVIGEPYAGKTSFITRYVNHHFNASYRATVGVDFALKVVEWKENKKIKIQLWDIAGQERFADMTRVFYKDGVGACIVFDASKPLNLDTVRKWKTDLDNKVTLPDGSPVPCILIANKSDLLVSESDVDKDVMEKFCKQHKFIRWYLTSAKANKNVDESMGSLIDEIMKCNDIPEEIIEKPLDKIDIINNNTNTSPSPSPSTTTTSATIKLNGQVLAKEKQSSTCSC